MFKDEPPIDDAIEKVLELATPEQVTTLDPTSHNIDREKLAKFVEDYDDSILNFTEKGPDYLIIDNFLEHFGLDSEALSGTVEIGALLAEETLRPELSNRQDLMLWFKGLTDSEEGIPTLRTIARSMQNFRSELNDAS